MRKTLLLCFALCFALGFSAHAEESPEDLPPEDADVFFMRDGSQQVGRFHSADEAVFRISRQVMPGQPSAVVTIPRENVERVEFAADPEREAFLLSAEVADLMLAARYWGVGERFLDLPRSPAARVGLRYAGLLLESGNPATRERALSLYEEIEKRAWSPEDRAEARRGRLRGLIATGRAAEAVAEAEELALTSEDPAVLIEAKYILATAASTQLRELEEANPRWEEDRFIRPERARLYHESLDLFLYPVLFHGSVIDPSARGLWAVTEIYRDGGELLAAAETARDVLALYPDTPQASQAQSFLESLPEEITQIDQEYEARQRLE